MMSACPGRMETEAAGAASVTVTVVAVSELDAGGADPPGLAPIVATQVLSTRTLGSPAGPAMGVRIVVHTCVRTPVLLGKRRGGQLRGVRSSRGHSARLLGLGGLHRLRCPDHITLGACEDGNLAADGRSRIGGGLSEEKQEEMEDGKKRGLHGCFRVVERGRCCLGENGEEACPVRSTRYQRRRG